MRTVARWLLPMATVAACLATPQADAPLAYAVRGARLVTVTGAPIESGAIVVRRGLIEAVRASAAIPAGAEVINGRALAPRR